MKMRRRLIESVGQPRAPKAPVIRLHLKIFANVNLLKSIYDNRSSVSGRIDTPPSRLRNPLACHLLRIQNRLGVSGWRHLHEVILQISYREHTASLYHALTRLRHLQHPHWLAMVLVSVPGLGSTTLCLWRDPARIELSCCESYFCSVIFNSTSVCSGLNGG